jgi:hypothetical protein
LLGLDEDNPYQSMHIILFDKNFFYMGSKRIQV